MVAIGELGLEREIVHSTADAVFDGFVCSATVATLCLVLPCQLSTGTTVQVWRFLSVG